MVLFSELSPSDQENLSGEDSLVHHQLKAQKQVGVTKKRAHAVELHPPPMRVGVQ